MVSEKAHEIPGGEDELDTIALRLHGKRYTALTDAEADAVWDDIESREQPPAAPSPCEIPGTIAAAMFLH